MSRAVATTDPQRTPAAAAPLRTPRIGYLLSQFPCYDETFILREIKALAERGVDMRIFSLRRKSQPFVQDDARPFLAVTSYAPYVSAEVLGALLRAVARQPRALAAALALVVRGCWRKPLTLLKTLVLMPKTVRFAELVRADGVEHLHAHWATYPSTSALVISRLTGVSWSFTCHAHDIFFDPSLLREKIEDTSFVLTCTADNKRYLEGLTAAATEKVRVSYHGLDARKFQPAGSGERAPAGAEGGPPPPLEVLSVGSLLECKGFDLLIEACRLLRDQGLDVRTTIAGGGPLEAALRQQVERLGLADRVHFTGYVKQAELIPLYRKADVFVLAAVLEIHWGIPNVVVEAAACGLPVVTTALPSLPELIEDGVHGLVAANKDARDLAEKMARLARDPELRRRMGRAGRARVETTFDVERTIETVIEPLLGRVHAGR